MQSQSLIAVCDILGFSNLVSERPLEEVVDNAVGWFRMALKHSVLGGDFATSPPPTRDLDDHPNVAVVWFSDTILFYTRRDTDEAVGELLQAVASLLFETILEGTTKIRAGVAYGEVYMDPENSIYVGVPIVEAHQLEEKQEWAGAALTPSACRRVRACGTAGEIARWWVTQWDVPLKCGTVEPTLAVNWNKGVHAPSWRLRWSESSELPPADANPSIVAKFENTRRFHNAHCEDCAGDA